MDNTGFLKWRFDINEGMSGSCVIDENETIYFGGEKYLFALYPNGTQKWKTTINYGVCIYGASPAIDDNGIIYVPTMHGGLYAVNQNGTIKWRYNGDIESSPVIGDDGTIYICDESGHSIKALYPNGTLKWKYKTGHVVQSSPAIGLDGTVLCGSHDEYIHALHPNNGTLKWKFKTGSWVHGSPSIGADGTVYIGSDDKYLYALHPNNGTMKWKCSVGSMRCSPSIDNDGILYFGVWEEKFLAVYPNGTKKWVFHLGDNNGMWGSTAAISKEGTIYFGMCYDMYYGTTGDIIALFPDGTLKWRKSIGPCHSSPAIGKDCTVYIQSMNGYISAYGRGEIEVDANGPYYGLINQPVQFEGNSKGGYSPHSYQWDFGDTLTFEEQNPLHTYTDAGNYTVTLTVTDNESNIAVDTTYAWIQDGNTQPNQPSIDGPSSGKAGTSYDYIFTTTDPDGSVIYLYVDWDDGSNSGWVGPYDSGDKITLSHKWSKQGTYTIKAKSKDPYDEEGPEGTFEVEIPRYRATSNLSYQWFLEHFPLLERLLGLIRYT